MASTTTGSASQVRQKLLQGLLDSVKQCQVRYGAKSELATGDQEIVLNLCRQLELVLNHGLKDQETSLGLSVIRNVRDLVGGGEVEGKNLWKLLKKELNGPEQERFLLLPNISSDLGRSRAWIRSSLNEQSLEKFLQSILGDKLKLRQYYEEWAFIRDEERCVLLPSMAAGLTSVRFALRVDDPELNGELDTVPQVFSNSLSSLLPALKPNQSTSNASNPEIAQGSETEHVIKTSKIRTKMKKKRIRSSAQVVSFDDESLNSPEAAEEAVPQSPFSPFNTQSQDDSFLFPNLQEGAMETKKQNEALEAKRLDEEDKRLAGEDKKPVRNSSSSSIVSSGSDVGKERRLTLSFDTVSLERLSKESDEIDIYNHQHSPVHTSENRDKSPKFSEALTPVTNKDIGALFPVAPGESSRLSLDLETETETETDYTPNQTKSSLNSDNISMLSVASGESSKSNRSLGKDDLRKALLSVMEKKEELEHQVKTLRASLSCEVGTSRDLKAELETVRETKQEQVEKLESRNSILSRENELLKHQLKKYVGAVQKLRDGPQAYETLAKLETNNGNRDLSNKYIDYHYEASEYEKKLIQVAEMHGELLEFNEGLQRSVQSRDVAISRLKAELVLLRGPLPDDEDDTSSLASSEISLGGRVLVNIWIPSVFLAGSGSSRHHVYQVYVRIRDLEWNVYRRYNQFYDLHVQTRKSDPVVASFQFPPKKSMGHRSERFVENRRRLLQVYLRQIVNYVVGTHPTLANCPDKETFIDIIPFFSDALPTNTDNNSRTTLVPRRPSQTMARLVL